jgi:hypothetical protein
MADDDVFLADPEWRPGEVDELPLVVEQRPRGVTAFGCGDASGEILGTVPPQFGDPVEGFWRATGRRERLLDGGLSIVWLWTYRRMRRTSAWRRTRGPCVLSQ